MTEAGRQSVVLDKMLRQRAAIGCRIAQCIAGRINRARDLALIETECGFDVLCAFPAEHALLEAERVLRTTVVRAAAKLAASL